MWEERWILFVSAADLARLVEGLLFILFDVLVGGGWEERQTLFVSADLAQLVEGLLFIFVWCFGGCPCVWCVLFLCRRCCCHLAGRACRTLIVDVLVLMVLCCNALICWTLLFDDKCLDFTALSLLWEGTLHVGYDRKGGNPLLGVSAYASIPFNLVSYRMIIPCSSTFSKR